MESLDGSIALNFLFFLSLVLTHEKVIPDFLNRQKRARDCRGRGDNVLVEQHD
jgi:hypothetical protein